MAQPPHYNPQQSMSAQQQSTNIQQMLGPKTMNPGPVASAMGVQQQTFMGVPSGGQQEKTMIDDFEANFRSCLAPLLPGGDNNMGGMTISQDKLRYSVEHSIQQFTEQARKVEAYFLKKHALVGQQQPELILQEQIEELKEEISRRDATIRNHGNKIKAWQANLRSLQNSLNDGTSPVLPRLPAPHSTMPATGAIPAQQVGLVQPNMMQQITAQRR